MPKRNVRHIWVVEMRLGGQWLPVTGTSLSRDEGRAEARHWRDSNPAGRFRLRRYVPAKETR